MVNSEINPPFSLLTPLRLYSGLMKRAAFALLFSLLAALSLGLSQYSVAQEVKRVVVLPFNAASVAQIYSLSLPAALQRSLNVVDEVYAPPVGDTLAVSQYLQEQDRYNAASLAAAFEAPVIVSGNITVSNGRAEVLLGFAGPAYPETKDVLVQGSFDKPQELVQNVVDAVLRELAVRVTAADRQQVNAVVAETPSLESLPAVGQASLRLPSFNLQGLNKAAERDGSSSWVLSERARALILTDAEAAALQASLNAIQAAPEDIEALVLRGQILLASGDIATARQAFDAALLLNPNHALALLGKGQTTENDSEAIAFFEAALTSYPRLVDAYLNLAARQAETDGSRALQTLRLGAQTIPDSIVLRRAVMQQAINLGDAAGALSYLKAQLAAPETSSPGLYTLAAALRSPDYDDEALALLREGRERYPESVNLALAEAELLQRQDDLAAAEAVLETMRARVPNNLNVLNALAILEAKQGKLDEASATLEGAPGQHETLQVNLAQVYLEAGKPDAALETLAPLLGRNPADAELYALYGVALGEAGRVDQALNALDQALALEPELELAKNTKELLMQQQAVTGGQTVELGAESGAAFEAGLKSFQAGKLQEALEHFNRARELEDHGLIAFYQALTAQRLGAPRAAVFGYLRALEAYPESDTVLNNLAYSYLQLNRYDLARIYLGKALAINPENAQAHLNLGLTYYALERFGPALDAWAEAIRLEPTLEAELSELIAESRERLGR